MVSEIIFYRSPLYTCFQYRHLSSPSCYALERRRRHGSVFAKCRNVKAATKESLYPWPMATSENFFNPLKHMFQFTYDLFLTIKNCIVSLFVLMCFVNVGINTYSFLSNNKGFWSLKEREYIKCKSGIEISYNMWISPKSKGFMFSRTDFHFECLFKCLSVYFLNKHLFICQ
jgi:hypothetical protein